MGYRRFQIRFMATMTSPRRLSALAVPLIAALGILFTTSTAYGDPGLTEIRADFSGMPDSVQRYTGGLGIGDPVCFLRDIAGNEIPPTVAQHQMDGTLGPQLMTHTVTDKRDLTYTARGHVMTTPFNVGGFQICDNPIGSFIQGDGQTTFAVDISTAGVASRKWPLIWFFLDGSLTTPLPGDPAFTDTVRDHANEVSTPGSAIFFKPQVYNGSVGWGGWRTDGDRFGAYWQPIPVTEDFAIRTPHQFVLDGRAIEVWVGGVRLWREEDVVPASWSGRRIDVRLDFVDYNSDKEGQPATTWHWDNIRLTGRDVALPPATSGAVTQPSNPTPPPQSTPATATPATPSPVPTSEPTNTPASVPATPAPTPPPTGSPRFNLSALFNLDWRGLIDGLVGRARRHSEHISPQATSPLLCSVIAGFEHDS